MIVPGYPLLLDLTGRTAVVVGAGAVGTRRTMDLLEAGALVHLVAPAAEPMVRELAESGRVRWSRRAFADEDVDAAWLVVAATDSAAVNARVAEVAQAQRIFCVRADDAPAGTARTPAVVRRDPVTIAVNGGDDPRRAARLRDAISLALDTGALVSRPVRRPARGSVTLVGGGPGDPELITVRGRRLVAQADVVVVDRLAPRQLLAELADAAEVIDCGKSAHRHNLSQAQINEVIVERARRGLRVVRLKGGDPFVFGRGGEEVEACMAAGVDVSVVPGLSSVTAGPALAGIPLTHRGVAGDFAVVSGHLDPGLPREGGLDWPAMATGPDTLVLLMAMARLDEIAQTLVAFGRPSDTPAAVIHRAGTPRQRVIRAPLSAVAAAAEAAGAGAPAVVVVGAVAALDLSGAGASTAVALRGAGPVVSNARSKSFSEEQ